ncbi:MAG: FAD-binding oxidoreductase [Dehalococcoidia bacterium]
MSRRSYWGWGLESDEPTEEQRVQAAERQSMRFGRTFELPARPDLDAVTMRAPRISAPATLAHLLTGDKHERASHSYGKSFRDKLRAFRGQFPNPPDLIALPKTEDDVRAVLEWCDAQGYIVVPYGGGSSVVGGVEPPEASKGVVTLDLREMSRVLEVDATSRAARIQAGVLGPDLETQLRPHGFTLRHYPQSFEWSTLGGWIVTRSGGHYATNGTHIDDFVESVRMLTPRGAWESRRLPGSGAGPSPDRMILGSEGILGVVTEAWMRVQGRPVFRGSASVTFATWETAALACKAVVQAKLWPANARILDPVEAGNAAGLDGTHAILILGFESADVPVGHLLQQAMDLAKEAGGTVDESSVRVVDNPVETTDAGRQGAVGEWRNSFIRGPYNGNMTMGLGMVGDTFETSITWDRWPDFDRNVRAAVTEALQRVCGGGTLSCRFTHVYPDGPAPYYTFSGLGTPGGEFEMWAELKKAASDAVMANGGTITHHHAVGRDHRPWYDIQRPDVFAEALRAAKKAVDPNGILNPGVLIDP